MSNCVQEIGLNKKGHLDDALTQSGPAHRIRVSIGPGIRFSSGLRKYGKVPNSQDLVRRWLFDMVNDERLATGAVVVPS
jgi:hypothetical protein